MKLSELSNQELIANIQNLRGTERETTLSILCHLNEIERRDLVAELGYSSLFNYCKCSLGYSEASTYRRISAARAIELNPELAELFVKGSVTLCSISAASTALREKEIEVKEIAGKSKSEVIELVAPEIESKPKESIRVVTVHAPSTPLIDSTPEEQRYEIKFSLSKEVFERFNEARRKLSNATRNDPTLEGAFIKLLDHYLSPKERKALSFDTNNRYIPRSIRRELYARDNGRCCFVSKDGIRCTESKFIHVDHVVPFAKGGKTELSNLRLLCSAHNKHCAENEFGKEFIQQKITTQLNFLQ